MNIIYAEYNMYRNSIDIYQPSTGHTSRTCFASMRTFGSYEKGA